MDAHEQIESKLRDFAAAMHAGEQASWKEYSDLYSRRSVKSQLNEQDMLAEERQKQALREIFKKHCVEWANPNHGITYGDPPEYHPDYFEILEVNVKGKKATRRSGSRNYLEIRGRGLVSTRLMPGETFSRIIRK